MLYLYLILQTFTLKKIREQRMDIDIKQRLDTLQKKLDDMWRYL